MLNNGKSVKKNGSDSVHECTHKLPCVNPCGRKRGNKRRTYNLNENLIDFYIMLKQFTNNRSGSVLLLLLSFSGLCAVMKHSSRDRVNIK